MRDNYIVLGCVAIGHPHHFFHLRMKQKLESVMADLKSHSSEIDKIYTKGVVDGFCQECFPCKQFELMSILSLFNSSCWVLVLNHVWGPYFPHPRHEDEMEQVFSKAKKTFGSQPS